MNDAERIVRRYLARSAGNCNHLSDYVIDRFVCFVRRGDLTLADLRRIGGESGAALEAKVQRRLGR